MTYTDVDVVFY